MRKTEITKPVFKPAPGYILIDPLEKDEKSSMIAVHDKIDQPHKGTVLAIGPDRISDYGQTLTSPVKVGDFVLYSIAGIERFKMDYKGNLRYEFVMCPFTRILGVIGGKHE